MSLRVEKGYGSWGRDYSPEYWPQEAGSTGWSRSTRIFSTSAAWRAIAAEPPRELMMMLDIEAKDADATGGEPIFLPDGTPVGQVTSGAYGYFVGQSLALAYVKAGSAKAGDAVTVAILGRPHDAVILKQPPFDPEGKRLRA